MCRWFVYLSPQPNNVLPIEGQAARGMLLEDVLVNPEHAISKQVDQRYLPGLVHYSEGESFQDIANDFRLATLRNVKYNRDGYGIAWYTDSREQFDSFTQGPRPAHYRVVAPPVTDRNFLEICANTTSSCILAHIRAASRPPVVSTNNHPFLFGRHCFMHNGTIAFFPAIKILLLEKIAKNLSELPTISGFEPTLISDIHGNTDSEHLAALYMSFLFLEAKKRIEGESLTREEKDAKIKSISSQDSFVLEDMSMALLCAIRAVIEAQKEKGLLDSENLSDTANSLNLCATDGEKIVATRFRNHPTEQPASLYWTKTGGVRAHFEPEEPNSDLQLENLPERNYIIIASEPTTYESKEIEASKEENKKPKKPETDSSSEDKDWKLFPKNSLITVDEHGELSWKTIKWDEPDKQDESIPSGEFPISSPFPLITPVPSKEVIAPPMGWEIGAISVEDAIDLAALAIAVGVKLFST